MSGVADIPASHCHWGQPLRFGEYLERINRGEQVERAAERRSAPAADGEGCRWRRHAPGNAPRLAEVIPVPTRETLPVRFTPRATVQHLLPTGSIIDVTV